MTVRHFKCIGLFFLGTAAALGYGQTLSFKTDLAMLDLKGRVKSTTTLKFRAAFSGDSLISGQWMESEGLVREKTDQVDYLCFDSSGMLIETRWFLDEQGTDFRTHKFTYTPSGQLNEWTGSTFVIVYTYDSIDRLTEIRQFGINYRQDSAIQTHIFTYDSLGRKSTKKTYLRGFGYQGYHQFLYDSAGLLYHEIIYSKKNIREFSIQHPFSLETFEPQMFYRQEGCSESKKNDLGNYSVFEYDDHGNWVKQIKYCSGYPFYIKFRKIEYF